MFPVVLKHKQGLRGHWKPPQLSSRIRGRPSQQSHPPVKGAWEHLYNTCTTCELKGTVKEQEWAEDTLATGISTPGHFLPLSDQGWHRGGSRGRLILADSVTQSPSQSPSSPVSGAHGIALP